MKRIQRRTAPDLDPAFLPHCHPVLRRVLAARAIGGDGDLDHSLARLLPPDGLLGLDRVTTLLASMRDPSVVPLGSASVAPELLPIRALNRTLAAIARETGTAGASYDAPPGLATLRRQLAKRSLSWGMSLDEGELVTTVGAMEALHLCLRAVAKAGDTVAVETPAYFGLLQLIEEMGLRALEIPADPRTGMDLDLLEAAFGRTSISAILVTPNFCNPLGARMPDEAKERLVKLAARHDVPIIEDDIYGDLAFDGSRPRPAKSFDRDGRVLLCGSVSKTLAPGYRIGWVAPGRYQATIERLKFSQSIATPTLLQMAVAEYLERGGYDRHLRVLRSKFASQVQRFREEIASTFPVGDARVRAARWFRSLGRASARGLGARAASRGARSRHRRRAGPHLLGPPRVSEFHPHLVRIPVVATFRRSDGGARRNRATCSHEGRANRSTHAMIGSQLSAAALLELTAAFDDEAP